MSLSDWLDRRWLVKHQPDRREIRELLGIADRAIADAEVTGISTDARLSIAHNATLQLATAALTACGFRFFPVQCQFFFHTDIFPERLSTGKIKKHQ